MSLHEKIYRWFWVRLGPPDFYFFDVVSQLLELGITLTIRRDKFNAYIFEYSKRINGRLFCGGVSFTREMIEVSTFRWGISARIIERVKDDLAKRAD